MKYSQFNRKWENWRPHILNERLDVTGFICKSDSQSPTADLKFKIVLLPEDGTPSSQIKVHVFCSEKGEWEWFKVSSPRTLQPGGLRQVVVYDGLLHWVNGDCIAVYDPFNDPQQFSRVIDLPIEEDPERGCCGISEGHICIAELTRPSDTQTSISIWKLDDYSEGRWCLCHKVLLNHISFQVCPIYEHILGVIVDIEILALHPTDVNVIYIELGDQYTVRCHMKKEAGSDTSLVTPGDTRLVTPGTFSYAYPLVFNPFRPTQLASRPH